MSSGRNAGRLPKIDGGMPRVHSNMPADWISAIEKAARVKGVSRSYYIARASHAQAVKDLKASKKAKAA